MPTITMQDGAKITLPDGATDEQIQEAAEDYASTLNAAPEGAATQQAAPILNQQQLDQKLPINRPTNIGAMPNGAPLPYGIDPAMLAATNKSNAEQNQQNAALRQDTSALQKIKNASDEGFLMNMLRGAGHTINQFGEGAEELVDKYLPEPVSRTLNQRPFADNTRFDMTSDQRRALRKDEMQQAGEDAAMRSIGAPVSSTVGAMLPYLVTGKAAETALDAFGAAVSPITRSLTQKALTRVGGLEGRGGIAGGIGESANLKAARMNSAPKIPSEFQNRVAYGLKAPAIGAAEGSVNYDQTSGEGALASLGGLGMGLFGPLRTLDRVENVRDAAGRQIIKDMDKEGFSLTPGVRTGNRQMQTEEAGIKNSDVLGDYYHQTITRPNQRKMTEIAGDAIGLDGRGRDSFSPAELEGHLTNLSNQYKQLENTTTGKFTSSHIKTASDILADLKPTATRNTSPDDAMRYAKVKSITDQIRAESTPGAGVSGINNRSFDGSQYQGWRQRIQDEATQAFQNGDQRLGNAMNKLKANLDSALETGMGKGKAADWKDLNERYAMTNLLMKKGMTPTGEINPLGITSAVMNGDEAIRTLTGRGGRIQNFQKIAKYNDVLNNVEGGSLTGLGSADFGADRSLTKMPFKYKLPLYARTTGAYRLGNLPIVKPHRGFDPLTSLRVGRAIGMTEPLDKISTAAGMGIQGLEDWYNNAVNGGNNGN